jgi:hypothetical protein|tara:strand:- start:60472 stop:60885 length:414 start_codon:yes stop_codon:yes gene_type:complete
MPKITILSVALSAFVLSAVIPFMEISESHLFNPEWPSHARLHEAWQLIENAAISILAFILVWKGIAPRLGIVLGLILSTSFLIAWLAGPIYGGSMVHSDGTEFTIGGISVVVVGVAVIAGLLLLGWRALSRRPVASK